MAELETTNGTQRTSTMTIRRGKDRGHANHGWLDTYHTFSFADYHDPRQMGFRGLRVINEDFVQGGSGFATHPHRDMEIVTYVLEGALEHRDSMGNGSVIRPGDVQRMSAGTGVLHSEHNASKRDRVHLLQIWILPERTGVAPSYEQKRFEEAEKRGRLRVVASRDGREGSVQLNADAAIHAALLAPGERVTHAVPAGRHAWVHVVRGAVRVGGELLAAGDAAGVHGPEDVTIDAVEPAEVLLFDLA